MPTLTDPPSKFLRRRALHLPLILVGLSGPFGCGGEPSLREIRNAQAFEALLTAVSLRNVQEVERDAKRIDQRHDAGELSDGNYQSLSAIIAKARAKDWGGAAKQAYDFRAQFGDRGSYFR